MLPHFRAHDAVHLQIFGALKSFDSAFRAAAVNTVKRSAVVSVFQKPALYALYL
jgi:hypothetical protein